jgi:hypothetical protein
MLCMFKTFVSLLSVHASYNVGRAYNCWMLNLLVRQVTSRFYKVNRRGKGNTGFKISRTCLCLSSGSNMHWFLQNNVLIASYLCLWPLHIMLQRLGCGLDRLWSERRYRQRYLPLLRTSERFWVPPSVLLNVYRPFYQGAKLPGFEINNLTPSTAEIKKEWSRTSTPLT